MIHQELNLLQGMTVAENIFLGHELARGPLGWLDREAMERRSEELLASFGQAMSGRLPVRSLSLAQQQMVEIARPCRCGPLIIMDEPFGHPDRARTVRAVRPDPAASRSKGYRSSTSPTGWRDLQRVRPNHRDAGRAHHRHPADLGAGPGGSDPTDGGPPLKSSVRRAAPDPGAEVLRLEGIGQAGKLEDIDLRLCRGEIVGLTGLVGAGRTELAGSCSGSSRPIGVAWSWRGSRSGAVAAPGHRPWNRPADRGPQVSRPGARHAGAGEHHLVPLGKADPLGLVDSFRERESVLDFIRQLAIKTPRPRSRVRNLSGGTQQKVVLSKWLFTQSRILIFDEPTRGIDVGAKEEIYRLMLRLVDEGIAILMISSELPEVLRLCDRILVMHAGPHYRRAVPGRGRSERSWLWRWASPRRRARNGRAWNRRLLSDEWRVTSGEWRVKSGEWSTVGAGSRQTLDDPFALSQGP